MSLSFGIVSLTHTEIAAVTGASVPPGFVLVYEFCRGGYVHRLYKNPDPNAPPSQIWYRDIGEPCGDNR